MLTTDFVGVVPFIFHPKNIHWKTTESMNLLNGNENSLEGALKPQRPRTRVANRHKTQTDNVLNEPLEKQAKTNVPSPKPEKRSGWGEMTPEKGSNGLIGKVFGKGDRKMNEDSSLDSSFKGDIPKFMDEEEDEGSVATIPTLDKGMENAEVANAPEYHGNKVQSLYELDKELAFALPSAEQILEEDAQWTQSTLTQLLNED